MIDGDWQVSRLCAASVGKLDEWPFGENLDEDQRLRSSLVHLDRSRGVTRLSNAAHRRDNTAEMIIAMTNKVNKQRRKLSSLD
jgi:hypothetical protein